MIKRLLSALFALVLLLPLLLIEAAAEDAPLIYAENCSVTQGESVTVYIKAENLPETAALDFAIYYDDSAFAVTNASAVGLLSGTVCSVNTKTAGSVTVSAVTSSPFSGNGNLLTLCFEALDNAPVGAHRVNIAVGNAYTAAFEEQIVSSAAFSVTVTEKVPVLQTMSLYAYSISGKQIGDSAEIELCTMSVSDLGAIDFVIIYDDTLLTYESLTLSPVLTNAPNALWSINSKTAGYIKVSMILPKGVDLSWQLVISLAFTVKADVDASAEIKMHVENICDTTGAKINGSSTTATVGIEKTPEAIVLPKIRVRVDEETVDCAVISILADGETALAAGDFTLTFDSLLLSCTAVNKVGGMLVSNIKQSEGLVKFSYIEDGGISEDTVLCTMTFQKNRICDAEAALVLTGKKLKDNNLNSIDVEFVSSCVLVTLRIFEDVNGDGKVNISDVTTLLNYLATSSGNDFAYDVDNNGLVNITDVTTLLNYLSTSQ